MTDKQKIEAIKKILENIPPNYGGYIENALDIANETIEAITEVINKE